MASSQDISPRESSKILLIKAIEQKGTFWNSLAVNDAITSIRHPDDEELRRKAISSVALFDYANNLVKEIIDLIDVHWPE